MKQGALIVLLLLLVALGLEAAPVLPLSVLRVPHAWVLPHMDRLQKAHTSIVVLDACRDNPFRGAKSASKGLAMATGLGNQMIIYSTAPGKTAEDGPAGGNSPFTAELVKHILNSDKQIPLMMQDVNSAVYKQTGGKQDPWVGSNLKTDFFFSRPAIIEKP
ncbi:MAG TPA: caspase family protein [Candidatus Cloacimonadota bacterium]|nr:caspase family protein [Candidatus Cloacimonadota bacterium]